MWRADGMPWFHAALQLLDLRRQDRVLVLACEPRQVRDVTQLVGSRGQVTVVLGDRARAERIADLGLPQVQVVAHEPRGDERYGAFDAVLLAPTQHVHWSPGAYGELPRRNLRPGGRFVVDLPSPDMVPELAAACAEAGAARERLAALRGIGDDELGTVLRDAGLRAVQTLLGTHLLHLESPYELLDVFADALRATDEERVEFGHALVRRAGTTGPVDVLVHRTRVQALR